MVTLSVTVLVMRPFKVPLMQPSIRRVFGTSLDRESLVSCAIVQIVWKLIEYTRPKHNPPLLWEHRQVVQLGKVGATARWHIAQIPKDSQHTNAR